MKAREEAAILRNLVDALFMNINNSQIRRGTGLMFIHKIEPMEEEVKEGEENKEENQEDKGWTFTVTVSEPGYQTRTLQSIPFSRPSSVDRYMFEIQVYSTILTIFAENTVLSWDALGRQLNTDKELQDAAKETL
jgi:hypothetical protein